MTDQTQADAQADPTNPSFDPSIEAHYRAQVVERYNFLSLTGLPERDPGLSEVTLENVFVKLNTEVDQFGQANRSTQAEIDLLQRELDEFERSTRPSTADRERRRQTEARLARLEAEIRKPKSVTLSIAESLHQYRYLVVVGGPGSGKTTLTRWLALRFAQNTQAEDAALGPQFSTPRLPILLELRRFADRFVELSKKPSVADLAQEIADFISTHAYYQGTPPELIHHALAEGHCLLLVDGLDEVADAKAREAITEALTALLRRPGDRYRENLCIVTSRPHGFRDVTLPGFQTSRVQPFRPADVDNFVRHWYTTAYSHDNEDEASTLIEAIHDNERVLDLATNPLLCTIITIVYRNNRVLPNRRVELYLKCCEALLDTWERNKKIRESSLIDRYDWQTKLELLAPLAYWLHSETERLSAPEEEFARELAQVLQKRGLSNTETEAANEARSFLATVRDRSGLLQGRGDGSLEFAHRTFQEYLAARHIAAQPYPDYIDLVMEHLHEAWWREVHLLVIGHLGSGSQDANKVSGLLQTILGVYPAPWSWLRAVRFEPKVSQWAEDLTEKYDEHRILKWPVLATVFAIVAPSVFTAYVRSLLAERVNWMTERRVSWILSRELSFAYVGLLDCSPLGTEHDIRLLMANQAQQALQAKVTDPIHHHKSIGDDFSLIELMTCILAKWGQASFQTIEVLVNALNNDDSSVRQGVALSLEQLGRTTPQVVDALIQTLNNNDKSIREAVVSILIRLEQTTPQMVDVLTQAIADNQNSLFGGKLSVASNLVQLGQYASPLVVDALVHSLNNPNPYVRRQVTACLGQTKQSTPKVVDALVHALNDSDRSVQGQAASSLVQLGQISSQMVDALIGALSSGSIFDQKHLVFSLLELGQTSTQVVDRLILALNDDDPHIRREVASILVYLEQAPPQAVDVLIQALAENNHLVRLQPASCLLWLGKTSPQVVDKLIFSLNNNVSHIRREVACILVDLDEATPKVADVLIRALSEKNSLTNHQIESSLVKFGQTSAQVVEVLIQALNDSERNAQQVLASILVRLGQTSPEVMDSLIHTLNDSDYDTKQEVISVLGRIGQASPQVLSALIHVLSDGDYGAKRKAASVLGKLGQASPKVVDALIHAVNSESYVVQREAAIGLGQLGQASPKVVDVLIHALNDGTYDATREVASILVKLGQTSPQVVNALIHVLDDSDYDAKQEVVSVLGKLGQASPKVVDALIHALNSESYMVQREAAISLGQLGQTSPKMVDALVHALNNERYGIHREAAISLGQLGQASPKVVDALIHALNNERYGIQQEAVVSLGKLGKASPQVVDRLLLALNDNGLGVRQRAATSLIQLKISDIQQLHNVLVVLNRRLHSFNDDERGTILETIHKLVEGRPLPGYRWIPLRLRAERAKRRRQIGFWILGVAFLLLMAWAAAVATTYVDLDQFWVRFTGAAAGLVGLAAGIFQIVSWLYRPPWDKN